MPSHLGAVSVLVRDYHTFRAAGVTFNEAPRTEPYGTVAVFTDLYGNKWDLLQRRS